MINEFNSNKYDMTKTSIIHILHMEYLQITIFMEHSHFAVHHKTSAKLCTLIPSIARKAQHTYT